MDIGKFFQAGLSVVSQYLVPAAQIAAVFAPPPVALALTVTTNALPGLVGMAETALAQQPGATKKAWVLATMQSLAQTAQGVSTGGQAETWGKINGVLSQLVDNAVAAANAHATALATDPSTVQTQPASK